MMGVSLQPLQMGTAIAFIAEYWSYAIGFLVIGMVAYWTFDERDQTENLADTVERVGERARVVTGGFFGALGSLVIVIVSIFVTIGNELVMSFAQLGPWVMEAPTVVGQIILGGLALLNLEGLVPLKPWQFGTIFIAVLLVSVLLRYYPVLNTERGIRA